MHWQCACFCHFRHGRKWASNASKRAENCHQFRDRSVSVREGKLPKKNIPSNHRGWYFSPPNNSDCFFGGTLCGNCTIAHFATNFVPQFFVLDGIDLIATARNLMARRAFSGCDNWMAFFLFRPLRIYFWAKQVFSMRPRPMSLNKVAKRFCAVA